MTVEAVDLGSQKDEKEELFRKGFEVRTKEPEKPGSGTKDHALDLSVDDLKFSGDIGS